MKNIIKIIILVISIPLVSGCAAEYNITIDSKENYTENLKVTGIMEEALYDMNLREFWVDLSSRKTEEYTIDTLDDSLKNIEITRNKTKLKSITNSKILLDHAENIQYTNGSLRITPMYDYLMELFYPKLEDNISTGLVITVNIDVPFKVTENNADKIDGSKYTWIYTADNLDRSIILKYDKNTKYLSPKEQNNRQISLTIVIVTAIVAVLCFAGYSIYRVKLKNNSF